jgi:hypothetical protein
MNGRELVYELSTFDDDGREVSMTSAPDATALITMQSGLAPLLNGGSCLTTSMIRFEACIDDAKAQSGYLFDPRYSNRVMIGTRTIGVKSTELASADRLLFRLPTRGGDAML